ncbi:TetR/AcrR family transcriptional regulator [Novosphingobium sp. Gsoil 351]|uniref:TetR/AcrR family transcriptional regulator n=1 Tax=Novosphingobium sp. Gsoil 351 TaxID=2675225 RepID=UPI0012B451B0|nr:TetR/AcrR family transcriptional regulator [Novosphingobium sp. Gsoil 351]QGN55646.1 TetR family transcriptional regulator [Novosphingobium sp. Gsoil 351]
MPGLAHAAPALEEKTGIMADAKPRLTRDDWVKASRRLLVQSGIEEVKVDVLAKRLKVTRGSFYWHFKNRKDLLDALLQSWRDHKEHELSLVEARWPDGGAIEVARVWLSEEASYPRFDMAVRFWGWKTKAVAKIIRDVDDRWIAFFASRFRAEGQSETESFIRARVLYLHQIGYWASGIDEPLSQRLEYMPYYNYVLTGARDPHAAVGGAEPRKSNR